MAADGSYLTDRPTSPDAVTDGGGGADMRRARTRRYLRRQPVKRVMWPLRAGTDDLRVRTPQLAQG
ncbi:MAG: hypothetical protein ACRDNT_13580 [Streptosporangiaceae bacterium]